MPPVSYPQRAVQRCAPLVFVCVPARARRRWRGWRACRGITTRGGAPPNSTYRGPLSHRRFDGKGAQGSRAHKESPDVATRVCVSHTTYPPTARTHTPLLTRPPSALTPLRRPQFLAHGKMIEIRDVWVGECPRIASYPHPGCARSARAHRPASHALATETNARPPLCPPRLRRKP